MKIGLMLFGMKDDLKQVLVKMASDYIGPAGAIPFERLVARHLGIFKELRERGLTWEQISRLLAGAGIFRSDGIAFPPSHLRGVFGRQHRRAAAPAAVRPLGDAATARAAATAPAHPPKTRYWQAIGRQQAGINLAERAVVGSSAGLEPLAADAGGKPLDSGKCSQRDGSADSETTTNTPHRDRAGVLTLMRQAVLARRSG